MPQTFKPAEPKMSAPVSQATQVVPVQPAQGAILPQSVVKWASIAVALAGVTLTAPTLGIPVPPQVLAVAGLICALGAALGIASPGVRVEKK